jgi:hypothetical protein
MDYSFFSSLNIPVFLASASGEHNILQDIGISIVFATVLAHIAKLIKQPLIL